MTPRTIGLIAVATLGCLLGCTGERVLEPHPAKAVLYVSLTAHVEGVSVKRLYTYDADSLDLIDSLPIAPWAIFPTNNPSELIVQLSDTDATDFTTRTFRLNLQTGAQIEICRGGYRVIQLGGGTLLAYQGDSCSAEIYDATSGAHVRTVRSACDFGESDSPRPVLLYKEIGDISSITDDTIAVLTDACTGEMLGRFVPRLASGANLIIASMRLHQDGTRVMFIGLTILGEKALVIGDFNSQQVLFEHPLANVFGEIAVSSDGAVAAASDPGDFFSGGPRYIEVIDVAESRYLTRLDVYIGLPPASIGRLLFLPGERLATGPAEGMNRPGPLSVVDLRTLSTQSVIQLPYSSPDLGIWPEISAMATGMQ